MKQPTIRFWLWTGIAAVALLVAFVAHSLNRAAADAPTFVESSITATERKMAAFQAADERGEFLGSVGTSTPEELFFEIFELRAEPYAPLVLEKLEATVPKLKSERERLKAAAILNRYGRRSGTGQLIEYLRQNPGSWTGKSAAAALILARESSAVDLIAETLPQTAQDSEVAQALLRWKHPKLIERTKALLNDPALDDSTALRETFVLMLAAAGDPAGIPILEQIQTSERVPWGKLNAEAALVRLGEAPLEPFLNRAWATTHANVAGFYIPDALRHLGPELGIPELERILREYIEVRKRFGRDYAVFAAEIHAGTKSPGDGMWYPAQEEALMAGAVEILADWNVVAAKDLIADALDAAQEGRYIPLLNRNLMTALVKLDPAGAPKLLLERGHPPKEIEAAQKLAPLPPLPRSLAPHQKSISLSKESKRKR